VNDLSWLPKLITLEDSNGSWEEYLEAIYAVFRTDFVDSRPLFLGNSIGLRKYENGGTTLPQGKEATFWHFISEGETEENRIPDFRRCERIGWVRAILDRLTTAPKELMLWKQMRHGKTNYAIALPDFSYIIFLGERGGAGGKTYFLPLTAYPVEKEWKRKRYEEEWKANKAEI
jgi:hypothetical protein